MNKVLSSQTGRTGACPGCGVEIRSGSEFCHNCGGKIPKNADQIGERKGVPETSNVRENGYRTTGPGNIIPRQNARRRRSVRPTDLRNREPIQVVWRREEKIGIGYVLITLIAALIAAVLIAVAYFLR